jgi:hypothetical protein
MEFLTLPWTDFIIPMQSGFNNAFSRTINCSPNEIITGIKPNTSLSLLTAAPSMLPEMLRTLRRKEAELCIEFAANAAKEYYDSKHTPITIDVREWAHLKLYHGYNLPGKPNRKLSEQRSGPFQIVRRIRRLAYELKLPPRWKIHPIISVAHLRPAPKGKDP